MKYLVNKILSKIFINNTFKDEIIPWDQLFKTYDIAENIFEDCVFLSFYQSNINSSIIEYQKMVFKLFQIPFLQISEECTHGEFLTKSLKVYSMKKFIVFFDIDCVPLNQFAIIKLLQEIQDENTLSGSVQTANHKLNGQNIYVGPFFMGFSTKIIKYLGISNLEKDENHDVGGILTTLCKSNNIKVKFWFPTEIEVPKWNLYPRSYFGLGTTYDGLIYHAFEIREKNNTRFIKKCKSILSKYA